MIFFICCKSGKSSVSGKNTPSKKPLKIALYLISLTQKLVTLNIMIMVTYLNNNLNLNQDCRYAKKTRKKIKEARF